MGDARPEVTAECFAALLRLAPSPSLEFVADFVRRPSHEIAEAAAFALGESHLAAAFPLLRKAWEETARAEKRRALLLAMAMLRVDEAVEFLFERVEQDTERAAADAIAALAIYGRDEAVRARLENSVSKRKSAALAGVLEREIRRG